MEPNDACHRHLVAEIVEHLLEKFKRLPVGNRELIVLSTIEAAAWITAMETRAHVKKTGCDAVETDARTKMYIDLYASILDNEMREVSGY